MKADPAFGPVARGPLSFDLAGETFRCLSALPASALVVLVDSVAESGVKLEEAQGILELFLYGHDHERLHAAVWRDDVYVDDVVDVVAWLLETELGWELGQTWVLVLWCRSNWSLLDGRLALSGVDPMTLPLRRLLSAAVGYLTELTHAGNEGARDVLRLVFGDGDGEVGPPTAETWGASPEALQSQEMVAASLGI